MDPEMEAMLFEWCLNEINRNKKPISRSSIKQQAKVLSQNKGSFKASKGWLDKFMKRFNYSERMKNILNEAKRGKMEEENKEKEKNDTKINIFADNIFHFSLSKKENNNMI